LLCTLIFQTHILNMWSSQATEVVNEATFKVNLWVSFKIARSAARWGIQSYSNINYFVTNHLINLISYISNLIMG